MIPAQADQGLSVSGVSAAYAGPDVVHRVSIDLQPGEVLALLGPNGAGKSTLVNAISGLVRVTAGRVRFRGADLTNRAPYRIVAAGIAQVPQGREVFGYSTCAENLSLGGYLRRDRSELSEDVERFLEDWPLARHVLHQRANLCSGGEQQVTAIGRALMSRPKVLLMDEPSMGLAPILVERLYATMRESLRQEGWSKRLALLLVEQNVRKALEVADRVCVMVNGQLVFSGAASDLTPSEVAGLYMESPSATTPSGGN